MSARIAHLWLSAVVLLALGCSEKRYELRLGFGAGVTPSSVLHVDAFLLDRCPDAAIVSAGADPTGRIVQQLALESSASVLPSFGSVPSGSYGLYARGFDASCQPIAAACTTVALHGNRSGVLSLELAAAAGTPACAPAVCVAGRCGGTVADAGMDSGTDAGMDSGTDAGTDGGVSTCTLVASADGFTSNYTPRPSSGTDTTIAVYDGDGVSRMRGYVSFDPVGTCAEGGTLPATITVTSATLTMTVLGECTTCNHSIELRRAASSWTETSVGAGTDPSVAAAMLTSFTVPASGTVSVTSSLAADVQAWHDAPSSHFGYRIAQVASTGASATSPFLFGAREHATSTTRPRLTIVYTSP